LIKNFEKELIQLQSQREAVDKDLKKYEKEYQKFINELEKEIKNRIEVIKSLEKTIQSVNQVKLELEKAVKEIRKKGGTSFFELFFLSVFAIIVLSASVVTLIRVFTGR